MREGKARGKILKISPRSTCRGRASERVLPFDAIAGNNRARPDITPHPNMQGQSLVRSGEQEVMASHLVCKQAARQAAISTSFLWFSARLPLSNQPFFFFFFSLFFVRISVGGVFFSSPASKFASPGRSRQTEVIGRLVTCTMALPEQGPVFTQLSERRESCSSRTAFALPTPGKPTADNAAHHNEGPEEAKIESRVKNRAWRRYCSMDEGWLEDERGFRSKTLLPLYRSRQVVCQQRSE